MSYSGQEQTNARTYEVLDETARKSSEGILSYNTKAHRYCIVSDGRFISSRDVRKFVEKSALIKALRFGEFKERLLSLGR